MLERLARLIDRRRRTVLFVSVLVVFAAGAFGGPVVGLLDVGDDFSDPGSESIQARDTVERATGRSAAPDAIVLIRLGARLDEPGAVGTATVLLDLLLVPSLMALLGRWNWWAPRPLARLHSRLGLQEA